METEEFPVAILNEANYGTALEFSHFSEGRVCCSTPVSPHTVDPTICENCESKLHQETQARQDSEIDKTPLQSTDISLTLSDYGNENPVCLQLDEETNPDIEEQLKRNYRELFNHELSDTDESCSLGSRILKVVKRVLKRCKYVVGAVIGVPLIAGAAIAAFVGITAAGAVSPPFLVAIKWTNASKQRYFAICLGVVAGTLFLPILAPWGIYFLFKVVGAKLHEKLIHWIKRFQHRQSSFFEGTDESSEEYQMESISSREACVDTVSVASDCNSEIYQSTVDPDQTAPGRAPSEPATPVADNDDDDIECSSQEDENAAIVNRVLAFLGVIEGEHEDEDEEFSDPEDFCNECRQTVRRPGDAREVFSDEEDDRGRRDTQRLWARKVVSETSVSVKIPHENFYEREVVSGLSSSVCIIHQKRHEVRQEVNTRETKGTVDGGKSLSSLGEIFSGAQITQGTGTSCAPQCQDIKDLPEKGPKKKTKRRRKKRTGKQDPNSSSVSEVKESNSGTPQLQQVNDEDGKEKTTEIKEDTQITPDKKLKARNPVRKNENPSEDEMPVIDGKCERQGISESCTYTQMELRPEDESKHSLYAAHFDHID